MKTEQSRIHHVVGLVRPENFLDTIARMSQNLRTSFYGPFERPDVGLRGAISVDAGIEIATPLTSSEDNPYHIAIKEKGEHWAAVVVAVRDAEDSCKKLAELGYPPLAKIQHVPGDLPPGGPPFSDRFVHLEQFVFDPSAFGGLTVVLADIEHRVQPSEA